MAINIKKFLGSTFLYSFIVVLTGCRNGNKNTTTQRSGTIYKDKIEAPAYDTPSVKTIESEEAQISEHTFKTENAKRIQDLNRVNQSYQPTHNTTKYTTENIRRAEGLHAKLQEIKKAITQPLDGLKQLKTSLNKLHLTTEKENRKTIINRADQIIKDLKDIRKELLDVHQDLPARKEENIQKAAYQEIEEKLENINKKLEKYIVEYQVQALMAQMKKAIGKIENVKALNMKRDEMQKNIEKILAKSGSSELKNAIEQLKATLNSGKGKKRRKEITDKAESIIEELQNKEQTLKAIDQKLTTWNMEDMLKNASQEEIEQKLESINKALQTHISELEEYIKEKEIEKLKCKVNRALKSALNK